MNTHGHRDIANDAGLGELAAAYAAAGRGMPRLTAFYAGNWLTDLAQLLDEVVVESADRSAQEAVEALARAADSLVAEILRSFFVEEDGGVPVRVVDDVMAVARREAREALEDVRREVLTAVRWFYRRSGERQEWLLQEVRNVIFLNGYFRFVHPVREGLPPRMDFAAWKAVCDDRLTEYLPHDHLDRPPILPRTEEERNARGDRPPPYRSEIAAGTRGSHEPLQPDLYLYLREAIEVLAGTLGEVEMEWARGAFVPPDTPVDDTDVAWNLWLARFGYALHGIEDFFAHSTFIEHAAVRLGGEYFAERGLSPFDETAFFRRLKRWDAPLPADWMTLPPEPHLVTGIFDGWDTAFSLAHLAEETLDLDIRDPFRDDPDQRPLLDEIDLAWQEAQREAVAAAEAARDALREARRYAGDPSSPEAEEARKKARDAAIDAARKAQRAAGLAGDAVGREAARTLFDTLAFVEDPEAALKDPNNRVLRFVREPYEKWKEHEPGMERPPLAETAAREVVRAAPLFAGLDAVLGPAEAEDVRQRFLRAVVELSRTVAVVRGVKGVALSLFSVVMAVLGLIFLQKRLITLLFRYLSRRLARRYGREFAEQVLTRLVLYLARRQVKRLTVGPLKRFLRRRLAKAVVEEEVEELRNLLIFLAREAVYERLGHNRIGHHTLIAKDHGHETLYGPMKNCARLVHWHVVRTMLRHAEPVSHGDAVDWLVLLERYVRHPAATGPVAQTVYSTIPMAIVHVARAGDSLDSLARQYGATAVDPVLCTWEAIADANFDTAGLEVAARRDVLRQQLGSDIDTGFRVRAGTSLLIPGQRLPLPTGAPASGTAEVPWFETVMRDREGWRLFVPADPAATPRHVLPDPPLISIERLQERIAAALALRRTLEDAYAPPGA